MAETVSVRLPVSIVDAIRKLASKHNRTISGELKTALDEYIHRQERDE
jgi:predicted transcriptional regulator